jgi:PAS domain S-box-containing protein
MSISDGKIGAHTKTTIPALEHHEKLFRVLVENSSDAIALVSTEGAFTYVSPVSQKILGYTPEELLGRSPRELFPPNHIAEVLVGQLVMV